MKGSQKREEVILVLFFGFTQEEAIYFRIYRIDVEMHSLVYSIFGIQCGENLFQALLRLVHQGSSHVL